MVMILIMVWTFWVKLNDHERLYALSGHLSFQSNVNPFTPKLASFLCRIKSSSISYNKIHSKQLFREWKPERFKFLYHTSDHWLTILCLDSSTMKLFFLLKFTTNEQPFGDSLIFILFRITLYIDEWHKAFNISAFNKLWACHEIKASLFNLFDNPSY